MPHIFDSNCVRLNWSASVFHIQIIFILRTDKILDSVKGKLHARWFLTFMRTYTTLLLFFKQRVYMHDLAAYIRFQGADHAGVCEWHAVTFLTFRSIFKD